MVVLVTGASGQLGQALQFIAGNHKIIRFHFATSSEVDITDKKKLSEVFESVKPDFCINAAAYTAVDKAESEPDKATSINVDGVRNLAEICKTFHTTLIHISTDFVFDGSKNRPYLENDPTNPQSIYGITKRAGETAIESVLKEHFIIRTSWLYSQFGNNFMKTMLRLSKERDSINVVNDQMGTPTNAVDLAEVLIKIIFSESKAYGIYHFSNKGKASWYEFAKEIFRINEIDIQVNPIPTASFPTPATRPVYSVLNQSKIEDIFGVKIQDWKSALNQTII